MVRQLEDVAGDGGASEELRDLVAEVVAVVAEELVGGRGVARADLPEELLEHLPGDVGDAQVLHTDGRAVGRPTGLALLDAAAKVVLAAVDDNTGVPEIAAQATRTCQWWMNKSAYSVIRNASIMRTEEQLNCIFMQFMICLK